MGAPEAKIENYLRRRVREEGGLIRKVRWIGRRGAADNIVVWEYPRFAYVECKREGEVVDWDSPQGREIKRLRAIGYPVYVVNSKPAVDRMIAEVKGGIRWGTP